MPLGFQTINQGVIAFGFFNIDTDLLLLEQYFLFGEEFCQCIVELAREEERSVEGAWDVYHIPEREAIGDLMGAIHGIRHQGFIGEVYRRFPFPEKKEDFKQKPEGMQQREVIEEILLRYAQKIKVPVKMEREKQKVSLGEYFFDRESFNEMVTYVWKGGYPRWKDDIRPDYVMRMKREVERSRFWLFSGLRLS